MAWALVLVLVAGCSFETSLDVPRDSARDTVARDAPPDTRVAPFCDPADLTLLACYEFEGTANDASPHALHATMTNLTFVPGKVAQALQFGVNSAADVADSSVIDVASLTLEAWVHPFQLPGTGARTGIVDMDGQWGLFLHEPTGRLQCTMAGGISMQIDAMIPVNAWTHVACTYGAGTTTIYVNGVKRFQQGGGGVLATGGTSGYSLGADNPPGSGSRINGLIDQMRIFSRVLTEAEVCQSAACVQ
ncbi:MAG: LamG domain-containing protein [Myxococcota bacterium]|nr:LamG domain-containing protein [Deltaproteobacteria bacterium]MDQ3333667.1 LamG domain-containing protein [Myxococcota bacterium]